MSAGFPAPLPSPLRFESQAQLLQLESTLQELGLYQFEVELNCLGQELAEVFEQYPLLPGAILLAQGEFVGMISRRRFLEYLILPQGVELCLRQPLHVLHSFARTEPLSLPETATVLVAAQQALRRSPPLSSDPIVVQTAHQKYRLLDVHELNVAYWQIRGIETQVRYERTQAQMIQSDKMASLGRLVDGVAHEVLDPVSFIWGNLTHVVNYSQELIQLIHAYESLNLDLPKELLELKTAIELEFICHDLPRAISSIKTGAERLTRLATSLQNFCHIDDIYPKPADIHELLDGIILLLKSRLTSDIQIIRNYGRLPPVFCYAGQLNHVFMNILVNAVDVLIEPAVRQQLNPKSNRAATEATIPDNNTPPQIEITTQIRHLSIGANDTNSPWLSICIADNGPGMSTEVQTRILESFSIAKRAAKETSLSLSYQIITAKHGGQLHLRSPRPSSNNSTHYQGTEFEILLPLM